MVSCCRGLSRCTGVFINSKQILEAYCGTVIVKNLCWYSIVTKIKHIQTKPLQMKNTRILLNLQK